MHDVYNFNRAGKHTVNDNKRQLRQVLIGLRGPAKLHLEREQACDAFADFLVGERFAAVELIQSFPNFLAEPRIVVDVVLDQLLDVFAPLRFSAATRLTLFSSAGFKCTSMDYRIGRSGGTVKSADGSGRAAKTGSRP